MTDSTLFKNHIDAEVVRYYASGLAARISTFDRAGFEADALRGLEHLELKARVKHIAHHMHIHVGEDFELGLGACLALLDGQTPSQGPSVHFRHWPMAQYVEDHGLGHFDASMSAMKRITAHFSCEFAVRPFLARFPERTLEVMHEWAQTADVHVRRNASEGIRPRLPWGMRLDAFIADPSPVFAVLERLHDDPEEYVRRSVSNCLNDIAKDHPDAMMSVLERWDATPTPESRWIKQRALRTLVKQGNPRALGLLGFAPAQVEVTALALDAASYRVGDTMTIQATLASTAKRPQEILVDYRVHFVKANGSTRPKVFKWTTRALAAGERLQLTKRQHLRPLSTRRYHPGAHKVDIQVNGRVLAEIDFELRVP